MSTPGAAFVQSRLVQTSGNSTSQQVQYVATKIGDLSTTGGCVTRGKLGRPKTVIAAMLLAVGIAILDVVGYSAVMLRKGGLHWFSLVATVGTITIAVVLLYALYAGHRWARIVVLLLTLIGLPKALLSIVMAPAWSGRLVLAMWMSIPVAICVLLLSKSAREWYANAGS
jgi:hypothetical protein